MISKIRKTVLTVIERIEHPPRTRVRDKYILWPRRLGSRWYWLERVKWEEAYTSGYSLTGYDYTPAGYYFSRLIRDLPNTTVRHAEDKL